MAWLNAIPFLLMCVVASVAVGGGMPAPAFDVNVTDNGVEYVKYEPLSCASRLVISTGDSLYLLYGGSEYCDPNADRENITPVSRFAGLVREMVNHFGLQEEVRSKSRVYISYIWEIEHWPLLQAVNEDEDWPKNIMYSLEKMYANEDERDAKYREMVSRKILSENVYLPVARVFEELGCEVEVSPFSDVINFSKERLVKYGVFSESEARKDFYPFSIDPVRLRMVCGQEKQ